MSAALIKPSNSLPILNFQRITFYGTSLVVVSGLIARPPGGSREDPEGSKEPEQKKGAIGYNSD
jgi:hypothetical protein